MFIEKGLIMVRSGHALHFLNHLKYEIQGNGSIDPGQRFYSNPSIQEVMWNGGLGGKSDEENLRIR